MILQKFPSKDFPALPQIEIESLESWENVSLPESVLSLIKKKGKINFSPNVIINSYKVFEDFNLETNKKNISSSLEVLDDLHIFNDRMSEINNKNWQVIEYIFKSKEVGLVAQIIATTIIDIENAKFIIRFTGTAAAKEESENNDYMEIQKILSSIKISGEQKYEN